MGMSFARTSYLQLFTLVFGKVKINAEYHKLLQFFNVIIQKLIIIRYYKFEKKNVHT